MDAAEEIPQLVRPQKKPGVDGEAQAVAVTKVLDDDNLLREIIVRIGFPTTLVRAALVCKRWLAHASDRKLLSRFRKLHKPRLLGYYISVYLIHIEKFQLQVWLHNGDNWLLVDTICLHEMLGILWMAYPSTIGDQALANVQLVQVGDNGQFVFLRMGAYTLYLDIPSRTPCRVYENGVNDLSCGSIHPLMSVWPPTFPALMDDPARNAM